MPEVYFPGSDKPFRPVNAHGRTIPKTPRPIREPMYQLVVKRRGRQIQFGPKAGKRFVDELYEAVMVGIRVGVEKELSDPHVVLCL